MASSSPPLPEGRPGCFRSTVHGTVFAGRERLLDSVQAGDHLLLIPDPPPAQDEPEVWVHLASGEPIGHLPSEIAAWLWSWMLVGGVAKARAVDVRGADTPSWRRLLVEVSCELSAG